MQCVNMVKTRGGVVCYIGNNLYVPTTFEVILYCSSGNHNCCPLFKEKKKTVSLPHKMCSLSILNGSYGAGISLNSGSLYEGRLIYENRYRKRGCSEGIR